MKTIVYIDHENIGKIKCLKKIDGKYMIFVGANQKSVPTELVLASNNHDVEWIEISHSGKNALDFHIAFYLAMNINRSESHYIFSKDKGFDPLIEHIHNKFQKNVRRIEKLDEINPLGKILEKLDKTNLLSKKDTDILIKKTKNTNTKSTPENKEILEDKQNQISDKPIVEEIIKILPSEKNRLPKNEKKLNSFIKSHTKSYTQEQTDAVMRELFNKNYIQKDEKQQLKYNEKLLERLGK